MLLPGVDWEWTEHLEASATSSTAMSTLTSHCCIVDPRTFWVSDIRVFVQAKQNSQITTMSGRQGGKLKPLKAPKKEKKEDDEDEKAFKEKKKQEAEALKAAREKGAYMRASWSLLMVCAQLLRVSGSPRSSTTTLTAHRRPPRRWRHQKVGATCCRTSV